MKTNSFFTYYKEILTENPDKWCPFTHEDVPCELSCYRTNPRIDVLLKMLEKFRLCNQMLDSNRYFLEEYTTILTSLQHPETINSYEHFNESLERLSELIEILDKNVQHKLNYLTCFECKRLDESLVDYSNHCKFSSIIMAVSAVEFRLHWMIRKIDEERYEKEFGEATFGQIIRQFTEDGKSEEIKKILDPRHIPLIQLLNKYRILSAHPKIIDIPDVIADSIVSLSFAFLTDPEHSPYTPEELKCSRVDDDTEDDDKNDMTMKDMKIPKIQEMNVE
jgi:hypothetical protein